jgi:hypothetical protein
LRSLSYVQSLSFWLLIYDYTGCLGLSFDSVRRDNLLIGIWQSGGLCSFDLLLLLLDICEYLEGLQGLGKSDLVPAVILLMLLTALQPSSRWASLWSPLRKHLGFI